MLHLKHVILFAIGGGAYTSLELLFRRRSHISMFFLGGACFLTVGRFYQRHRSMNPLKRMAACSCMITAGELATGLAVNRDYSVWDYRALPGNFLGQICLPFSLLWMILSGVAGALYRWCDRKL